MDFEKVKQFIEENKDKNEDLKAYLQGLNPLTVDGMQKYLKENEDAKRWLDSEKDKHFNKGLETWMQKTFPSKLDEEIKKRYPDEDPKETELKNMKAEIEKMKADSLRKENTNKALKIAQEKKLPVDLIDYFIADTEENTIKNLDSLEKVFSSHVETVVNERLKSGNYTPPKGGKDDDQKTVQEIFKNSLNNNF